MTGARAAERRVAATLLVFAHEPGASLRIGQRHRRYGTDDGADAKFFLCFFLWEAGANIGPGNAAFHTVVHRRLNVSRSIERARRYSHKITVVVLKEKAGCRMVESASTTSARRARSYTGYPIVAGAYFAGRNEYPLDLACKAGA